MDDIRAGVYRHYKGPLYLVLGLAHDANADTLCTEHVIYSDAAGGVANRWHAPLDERTVVVYIGLQLDDAHTGPRLAVRSYDDFFAKVHATSGEVCTHTPGVTLWSSERGEYPTCSYAGEPVVPRFDYVGPTWDGRE